MDISNLSIMISDPAQTAYENYLANEGSSKYFYQVPDLKKLKADEGLGKLLLFIYHHPEYHIHYIYNLLNLNKSKDLPLVSVLSGCKLAKNKYPLIKLLNDSNKNLTKGGLIITQLGINLLKQNKLI